MRHSPNHLLDEYIKKRNFSKTSEPRAVLDSDKSGDYMIHLHDARRKHYDLRLQWKGVLKCWAVPKGPSYNPQDKRLAVRTEDHPDAYKAYEGVIPEKSYGAGPSLIWDAGEFIPIEDFDEGLKKGHLKFLIDGAKLKGAWSLIRMKGSEKKEQWLLVKEKDEYANLGNPVKDWQESIATGRSLQELEHDEENMAEEEETVEFKPGAEEEYRNMPKEVLPQLAVLKQEIPKGNWTYERKYDGYRLLVFIQNKKIRLLTRNGKDWTNKFPQLVEELEKLPVKNVILDGEVVYFDEEGRTDFSKLQTFQKNEDLNLHFIVFDLLFAAGQNLEPVPFEMRRQILLELFEAIKKPEHISLSEVLNYSEDMLETACEKNWEGIIAKKNDSAYHNYRHESWVKIKCTMRKEFVIIGMTHPTGGRSHFGSLLIAESINKGLLYKGRVGTGFSQKQLKKLYEKFKKYKVKTAPKVKNLDKTNVKMWLEPHYYAEIDYSEESAGGLLRHPVYCGLRLDKEYDYSSKRLSEEGVSDIQLTHPDRVLFEGIGVTKIELWEYYQKILDSFLRSNKNAPLTMVRCPQGKHKQCFYQKHFDQDVKHPKLVEIQEKSKKGVYGYISSAADLKALVQLGVLEFHAWNCRVPEIENPLYVVFDLDPGEGVEFKQIIKAAKTIQSVLEGYEKDSFVRTSGGKGLHVLTPVMGMDWNDAYEFSKAIAVKIAEKEPDQFTYTMSKAKRKGKIFIDYLRNTRGATSIANYSARAKEGAPVATPLRWDELTKNLDPLDLNIQTIPRRLAQLKSDPWENFWQQLEEFNAS